MLLKNLPILCAANLAQHSPGFIVRDRLVPNRDDVAMHPYLRRLALGDMQIGRLVADYCLQKLVKISHGKTADHADAANKPSLA